MDLPPRVTSIPTTGITTTSMSHPTTSQVPPFTQVSEWSSQGSSQGGDNYVASTGEFNNRMRCWIITKNASCDWHALQCAVVFKAGVAINLSLMTKDPDKYLECVTKHKSVADSLLAANVIKGPEYHKLKKLKSLNSESPKTTAELAGWPPSGKSAWDRHVKIRLKIRKEIGPLIPSGVEDTPSGTGLVQLFQRIAHSLFMNPSHNKDMLKLSDVM